MVILYAEDHFPTKVVKSILPAWFKVRNIILMNDYLLPTVTIADKFVNIVRHSLHVLVKWNWIKKHDYGWPCRWSITEAFDTDRISMQTVLIVYSAVATILLVKSWIIFPPFLIVFVCIVGFFGYRQLTFRRVTESWRHRVKLIKDKWRDMI